MTRVLFTGGTGFIGQHSYRRSLMAVGQVRVLDLRPANLRCPGGRIYRRFVLDPTLVDEALPATSRRFITSRAFPVCGTSKEDFHAVNCTARKWLSAAARKRGIARFLHCSTESILFRPSPIAGCGRRAKPAAGR